MRVAPERGEQVHEELFSVLLPHRRKLCVPTPDQRFERGRSETLLENRLRGVGGSSTGKRVLRCRVRVGASRAGVPPGDQPVGEFVHLALEARCREGLIAPRPVLDCDGGSVALFKGRKGEENLHYGGHVAAVVVGRDVFVSMCSKQIKRTCCQGFVGLSGQTQRQVQTHSPPRP